MIIVSGQILVNPRQAWSSQEQQAELISASVSEYELSAVRDLT